MRVQEGFYKGGSKGRKFTVKLFNRFRLVGYFRRAALELMLSPA